MDIAWNGLDTVPVVRSSTARSANSAAWILYGAWSELCTRTLRWTRRRRVRRPKSCLWVTNCQGAI